uniref:Uncharacterized protein n=1 Tax=Erythrolobus australicus TaxID=1077150 RepID=A0A7S1TKQ3_9RHOD|mmetsp:Transcript_2931/g.8054  ORF Transcript_2931/g.8054 Transcript_2931/m.8054 type:complete len:148 (+) Transcript_2931:465-908(+)
MANVTYTYNTEFKLQMGAAPSKPPRAPKRRFFRLSKNPSRSSEASEMSTASMQVHMMEDVALLGSAKGKQKTAMQRKDTPPGPRFARHAQALRSSFADDDYLKFVLSAHDAERSHDSITPASARPRPSLSIHLFQHSLLAGRAAVWK